MKKALRDNIPYELIISDLYYNEDHRMQNLKTEREMIAAIKKIQLEIKVIFFSAEHKPGIIESLFTEVGINGFVRKGRNDAKELKKAVITVFEGKKYFSADLKQDFKKLNSFEFSSYDITLISLLSWGYFSEKILKDEIFIRLAVF